MATRYIGFTAEYPQGIDGNVIPAASGGTLAGSQVVQVVFDDAIFGATPEGRQRLVAAVKLILQRIEAAKVWPLTTAS